MADVLLQAATRTIELPRQVDPKIVRRLGAVCRKAIIRTATTAKSCTMLLAVLDMDQHL